MYECKLTAIDKKAIKLIRNTSGIQTDVDTRTDEKEEKYE